MKKYYRFHCTSCKREADRLVDLTHYTPDRCTITLGCEGRLQLLEYRSSAAIASPPEIGITDWRKRGSKITPDLNITTAPLINLSTGALKQLVIAVSYPTEPAIDALFVLTLTVKSDTPKAYREYIFRNPDSFSTISGVESGLEKKALRFTAFGNSPDKIEVFVNGVQRKLGNDPEDFQVFMGNSSLAPPNTILFNTTIEQSGSITQVDVIISKEEPTSTIAITFKRNKPDESRTGMGAYENISYVDRLVGSEWKRFYLFTYDLDDSSIPLNSILVSQGGADEMFLLARSPYTQLDRYANIILPVRDIHPDTDFIKYFAQDTITTARATETSIVPIFPPLRFGKFSTEKTIKTMNAGVVEQLIVNTRVITGPDA
jgi:hypothetical protein